ncbi:muramoyltetrapeptide carboxypeptidase [Inhella inkyongensis]|uniref:Muramoyltetrapeptide carboxypeptidase n=1 Tax=Inhella inkyongensis TaxID=392593 RepID=A0A840S4T6_9BURK|nr:LD-carboxypeptidase [Inhella inkyongensis]MBB5203834.1 muramoyltetrapeptide carboxypeptidase [Inhella inkyongensis]
MTPCCDHASMDHSLLIFSPSGVLRDRAGLRRAVKHLKALGFEPQVDEAAQLRQQRFAGTDEERLAALHRVADSGAAVALAARGGYGMSRLLDRLDWERLAASVQRGTRWVGMSDLTALQLGLLAHARGCGVTWQGPLAVADFGRAAAEGGVDDITEACFVEAMHGELEAIGFRETGAPRGTQAFDGLEAEGLLWGGNLTMVCSLLGTPHWPRIKGGILFLEEVSEHPYRVERMLLQLAQAGVLTAQKAVLIGDCGGWKPAPHDGGYRLKDAIAAAQVATPTPILQGLPFGHTPATKVCLPVGAKAQLVVQGRDALLAWGHV